MGNVGDVASLPAAVRLRDAAASVPAWGYLRQPHRNITAPSEHETAFLKALESTPAPKSDPAVEALENLRREARVLSRSRNRQLRDKVIEASGGTCEACSTDFTTLEPRRWRSVCRLTTFSRCIRYGARPAQRKATSSPCVRRVTSSPTWGGRNPGR